jgi:hypothetical protein
MTFEVQRTAFEQQTGQLRAEKAGAPVIDTLMTRIFSKVPLQVMTRTSQTR